MLTFFLRRRRSRLFASIHISHGTAVVEEDEAAAAEREGGKEKEEECKRFR